MPKLKEVTSQPSIADQLAAEFPRERISWRIGSTNKDKTRGMALAYIDARDVMRRLDEVCGVQNWECRYLHAGDKKLTCEIGIRAGIFGVLPPASDWIVKADGAGETDFEGEKGSFSDAFKRAAVKWGIGRYLYDLESPWVPLEADGKTIQKGLDVWEYVKGPYNAAPKKAPEPPPRREPVDRQKFLEAVGKERKRIAIEEYLKVCTAFSIHKSLDDLPAHEKSLLEIPDNSKLGFYNALKNRPDK